MTRRLSGPLTAVVLVLLAGCDIGPIRRTAPEPPVDPVPQLTTPGPLVPRPITLPVPAGLSVQTVEFADRRVGYALATDCALDSAVSPAAGDTQIRCRAALAVTRDGGQSWAALKHPHPVARNQQLYVVDQNRVVLFVEGDGYYVSEDGGTTYARRDRDPVPWHGTYGLFCEPGPCAVVMFTNEGPVPLETQPVLPGELRWAAENPLGPLWAVSLADGRPYSARSLDRGRTWQRYDVPDPGRPLERVEMKISPDGMDVWLLGYHGEERLVFPDHVWLFDQPVWHTQAALGAPTDARSIVAGGRRMLTVLARTGLATVDDRYTLRTDWPRTGEYLTILRDGTLFLVNRDHLAFGEGSGPDRAWSAIMVGTR